MLIKTNSLNIYEIAEGGENMSLLFDFMIAMQN